MRHAALAWGLAVVLTLSACDDSDEVAESPPEQPVVVGSVLWPPAVEGDLQVQVADNPLATSYLILLDNSGSMSEVECSGGQSKFDVARSAIADFAASLPPTDNIALAVFTDTAARIVVPYGSGEGQAKALSRALGTLTPTEGTPLRGAIGTAYDDVTRQAQAQLGYGTHRLVIVTDGESQDGDPAPVARSIVGRSAIELHVIGFCTGSGHSLNIPGITRYYTADDPAALAEGLVAVRAETTTFDAVATFNE
ncbi:MAG: VWA domain-containing protein [Rhodospirillaceae bacterium]|nr:VWA domain-containing protein [Rhodospirillaceae bacterium]